MTTNYLMLKELATKYHPKKAGMLSNKEYELIKSTLCLDKMNILALRNLRDFVVVSMSTSSSIEDWDKMSAITYVIDSHIVELGGDV